MPSRSAARHLWWRAALRCVLAVLVAGLGFVGSGAVASVAAGSPRGVAYAVRPPSALTGTYTYDSRHCGARPALRPAPLHPGAGALPGSPTTTTAPAACTAANGGVRAIEASTRVAPWAGSSLSRLSTAGEKMYRVWGGSADQAGSWLTPIRPSSAAAAREGLALPAENAATYVSEVILPAGIRMQVGTAGTAFGQPGGWAQAQLLERIPLSSFGKGELLP